MLIKFGHKLGSVSEKLLIFWRKENTQYLFQVLRLLTGNPVRSASSLSSRLCGRREPLRRHHADGHRRRVVAVRREVPICATALLVGIGAIRRSPKCSKKYRDSYPRLPNVAQRLAKVCQSLTSLTVKFVKIWPKNLPEVCQCLPPPATNHYISILSAAQTFTAACRLHT